MVTSTVLFALIGTFLFKSANSAAIDYEPIKNTVNENCNARPGQVFEGLDSLDPGITHQGANFYFKPQLTLPQDYMPSHIDALISLLQQHHNSFTKDPSKIIIEKDKLNEILKPLMYLSSNFTKLPPLSSPLPVKSPEFKPVTSERLVIPEAPVLSPLTLNDIPSVIEDGVKKEESMILKEPTGVISPIPEISVGQIQEPIINNADPKPVTSEFLVIPEAPTLPPPSFNGIPPVVEEEVKKGKSIILKEPTGVFSTIPEISVGPIQEPIINDADPKPINSEFLVIPKAPVLPPRSLHDISSIVEKEMKKGEQITLDESTGVKEMSVGPIQKPIITDAEPKAVTSEFVIIPEAPTLPPLSFNDIPPVVKEEVKKEESLTLEQSTDAFPQNSEVSVGSIQEPVIINAEPKPASADIAVIPEAPTLPPLSFSGIPPVVEEVKKEESKTLEQSTDAFPQNSEVSVGSIQEPVIINAEPKPITADIAVIPEAPELPALSLNDSHIIEGEMK